MRYLRKFAVSLLGTPPQPSRARRTRLRVEPLEERRMLTLNPTGIEQQMLEMVNRMRMDPQGEPAELFISTNPADPNYFVSTDPDVNIAIDFFNTSAAAFFSQWSSLTAVAPVAWNEALYDAAEAHNNEMISQNAQSHQLPGELGLLARAEAAGYDWTGSVSVGENVFAYTESLLHGHTAFAVDWGTGPNGIQSPPGHRDNIMDTDWLEVGISIVNSPLMGVGDVGPLVMTQDFATRGNFGDPRVLGVVYTDADGDDFYDAGEGLGGVTITISNGLDLYTTNTMTAGGYQVEVPAGTYDVTASGGGLAAPRNLGSVTVGSDNVKVDLDTTDVGTITGTVFLDNNEDGEDTGEAKLAGWTVFVDANSNGTLDAGETSAITDAVGLYALDVIDSGTYTVAFVETLEYRLSGGSSLTQTVSVTIGTPTTGVDFGQVKFVTMSGSTVNVFGTGQVDVMSWTTGGSSHVVTAHGQTLNYDQATYNTVAFFGAGGDDQLTLTAGATDDNITFRPGDTTLSSGGFTISGANFEDVDADLGGGLDDRAIMYDGADNNDMIVHPTWGRMIGSTYDFYVSNSERVFAYATAGGIDRSYLYDGATDDRFIGRPDFSIFQGNNLEFYTFMQGFERNFGYATQGGEDFAFFYDSSGDDRFFGYSDHAVLQDAAVSYFNYAAGFTRNFAYATNGGFDEAFLNDSADTDVFFGRDTFSILRGDNFEFFNRVEGFDTVRAYSTTGDDQARFYDSTGNDVFQGYTTYGFMQSTGYFNYANGFNQIIAFATNGGNDRAYLYDSAADDLFFGELDYGIMSNANYFNRANGFDSIEVNGDQGGTNTLSLLQPLSFTFTTVGPWV